MSRTDKLNKLLHIVKVVIIADDSITMIDNSVFLVSFKSVQKGLHTIPLCEQRKTIGLYL